MCKTINIPLTASWFRCRLVTMWLCFCCFPQGFSMGVPVVLDLSAPVSYKIYDNLYSIYRVM